MLLALILACTGAKDDTGTTDAGDTDTTDTDTTDPDLVEDCATPACGGDPVGEWTVATTCWDDAPQPLDSEDCPTGTISVTDLVITGTVSVTDDGAYTRSLTSFQQSVLFHLPGECVEGFTCEDLQGFLEGDVPGVICGDATPDGCDCTADLSIEGDSDSGTWVAEDTTVTFTSDDGSDPDVNDYCADSDELWVHFYGNDGSEFSMLLTK